MNETERSFREDLSALLKKYNATITVAYGSSPYTEICVVVDANPEGECIPCANFEL